MYHSKFNYYCMAMYSLVQYNIIMFTGGHTWQYNCCFEKNHPVSMGIRQGLGSYNTRT